MEGQLEMKNFMCENWANLFVSEFTRIRNAMERERDREGERAQAGDAPVVQSVGNIIQLGCGIGSEKYRVPGSLRTVGW